jgi:copper chaperone
MSCRHCLAAITTALQEIEGVKEVSGDLATGRFEVEHDDTVRPDQMKHAIEEAGYEYVA